MVQPNDESKQQPARTEQTPAPAAGESKGYPGNLDKAAARLGLNPAAIEAQAKTAGQLQNVQGKPEGTGALGDKVPSGNARGIHAGPEADTKEDIDGVSKSPNTPADRPTGIPGHDSPASAAADSDSDEQFADDEYLDPASFAFNGGGGGASAANNPAGNPDGAGDPGEYDRAVNATQEVWANLLGSSGPSGLLSLGGLGLAKIRGVQGITAEELRPSPEIQGAFNAGVNHIVREYFKDSQEEAMREFMKWGWLVGLLGAIAMYGIQTDKLIKQKLAEQKNNKPEALAA